MFIDATRHFYVQTGSYYHRGYHSEIASAAMKLAVLMTIRSNQRIPFAAFQTGSICGTCDGVSLWSDIALVFWAPFNYGKEVVDYQGSEMTFQSIYGAYFFCLCEDASTYY
jgi:hypothetical protein